MINAPGDADVDITKAAVTLSLQYTTTLIGEDTDLLVLFIYLYLRSDKIRPNGSIKVYNINHLKEILGHDMCSYLLFIHAMTGCDTTSRIFGIGKKSAFQKLINGDHFLQSLDAKQWLSSLVERVLIVLRPCDVKLYGRRLFPLSHL